MGTKIHHGQQDNKQGYGAYNELIREALADAGLDPTYADVADTDTVDDKLRAFHQTAMDEVGNDVGTPMVKFGDMFLLSSRERINLPPPPAKNKPQRNTQCGGGAKSAHPHESGY